MSKRCSKCKELKEESEFYRDKTRKSGLRYECKACINVYRDLNKDRIKAGRREYHARYYAQHRERIHEKQRQYRDANPEIHKSYRSRNLERQRDYHREYQRRYREQNPEAQREYERKWRKANAERVNTTQHRRRARLKNAEGSHTEHEWLEVVWRQQFCCAHCGSYAPLTRDHIIPLSKGGSNYISNIQGLCLSCNSSKGAKLPEEL